MKKFIEQQDSTVPDGRRQLIPDNPVQLSRKRGRRKDSVNLQRLLFLRTVIKAGRNGNPGSREEFASAIGIDPRTANTLSAAFIRCSAEEDRIWQKRQAKIDRQMNTPADKFSIVMLDAENIIRRDFEPGKNVTPENTVIIGKDPEFGHKMHRFGFIMPDNCMLSDGICRHDRIVAAANIRPAHGDMVACIIPGSRMVTIRRYASTDNPGVFELLEGGTCNPMRANEVEGLLRGVVVSVQRNYLPRRLQGKIDSNVN